MILPFFPDISHALHYLTFENVLKLISIILTIYAIAKKNLRNYELAYQFVPWKTGWIERDLRDNQASNFEESYAESLLILWNAGQLKIGKRPREELFISIPGVGRIYKVCIAKTTHEDIEINVAKSADSRTVFLDFSSLEHEEGAIISIIHSTNIKSADFNLHSGLRAIKNKELHRHKRLPVFLKFQDIIYYEFITRRKLLSLRPLLLLCLYSGAILYNSPFISRVSDLGILGFSIIEFYIYYCLLIAAYYFVYCQYRQFPNELYEFMKKKFTFRNSTIRL